MIKWQDCFYLVPGSELSERSVRSSGSNQSLSLSARQHTFRVCADGACVTLNVNNHVFYIPCHRDSDDL